MLDAGKDTFRAFLYAKVLPFHKKWVLLQPKKRKLVINTIALWQNNKK
jgi:hypothetical protein